jgi:hypothetical protein
VISISSIPQGSAAQNSSVSSSASYSQSTAAVSQTAAQNSSFSSFASYSQSTATCTISQTSAVQNSSTSESITVQASSSSDFSSSASSFQSAAVSTRLPSSSDDSSSTISSSISPSQTPPSSTISNAKPSVSSSDCVTGGTCNSYKLLACPGGVCACGQDVNYIPTCFQDKLCADLLECNNNADCGANEACALNTCCGLGEYCVPLAVGCLTSPGWTAQVAPICKKIKSRSISALGGGEIGTDRLRC